MQIGTQEVTVFGRSINDLAADIAAACPTPQALRTARVTLGWDEEGALDKICGMMWPALIARGINERYRAQGITNVPGIGAQLNFPRNEVELTFTVE